MLATTLVVNDESLISKTLWVICNGSTVIESMSIRAIADTRLQTVGICSVRIRRIQRISTVLSSYQTAPILCILVFSIQSISTTVIPTLIIKLECISTFPTQAERLWKTVLSTHVLKWPGRKQCIACWLSRQLHCCPTSNLDDKTDGKCSGWRTGMWNPTSLVLTC